MNYKEFLVFLSRDGGRCYHCGKAGDDLVPQHRAGRGMGGSKIRNRKSNIITLCSIVNGLLEADADVARRGRKFGWKISAEDNPERVPVYETWSNKWWILNDDGTRIDAETMPNWNRGEN